MLTIEEIREKKLLLFECISGSRACGLATPREEPGKQVMDFCYVIDGTKTLRLKEWLDRRGYKQHSCGLVNLAHMKNVYALFYDHNNHCKFRGIIRNGNSHDVNLSSIPPGMKPETILNFNKEAYSLYCKEYHEYQDWVKKRNTERYLSTIRHGKNYDAKNMMHTFRLLDIALEIAQTDTFTTKRTNREELLAIKSGKYTCDELMTRVQQQLSRIETLFDSSGLQETPDMEKVNALLVRIRTEFYKSRS